MDTLAAALKLEGQGVISIVGGGGKTTLMYRLAGELCQSGATVLTTTTTRINLPWTDQSPNLIVAGSPETVLKKAERLITVDRHIAAASAYVSAQAKLKGFTTTGIQRFWQSGIFDWILVEADGAAQKPLKAPADHEPVVPPISNWLIALVGLDAVGKPLDTKWVFRPHIYSHLTGLPMGSAISAESVVACLNHPDGLTKGCPIHAHLRVFLNKADIPGCVQEGRNIARLYLAGTKKQPVRVIIGKLASPEPVVEIFDLDDREKP
jgi:probable selenium-dependent hydroxylase accessory protein YqeC